MQDNVRLEALQKLGLVLLNGSQFFLMILFMSVLYKGCGFCRKKIRLKFINE